jgi:hypothetical protein
LDKGATPGETTATSAGGGVAEIDSAERSRCSCGIGKSGVAITAVLTEEEEAPKGASPRATDRTRGTEGGEGAAGVAAEAAKTKSEIAEAPETTERGAIAPDTAKGMAGTGAETADTKAEAGETTRGTESAGEPDETAAEERGSSKSLLLVIGQCWAGSHTCNCRLRG